MAPKIQEDENIVNNNNKGDSPGFKLNIEDTAVHGGNTDSNSTNNRCVELCELYEIYHNDIYFYFHSGTASFRACQMKRVTSVMAKVIWRILRLLIT